MLLLDTNKPDNIDSKSLGNHFNKQNLHFITSEI